jgi:cytochrome P450
MIDGSIFYDPRAYSDLDRWQAAAATIRREDPVLRVEPPGLAPFWAVTRHAHVVEVERQPERFWNTVNSVLDPSGGIERLRATGADLKTLIHMDGAEHRDYRAITNDWFKPANLRRLLEERIAELSRVFVDRMLALGDTCDFASEIALYYPLRVIMSILGVPEADEPRMLRLTQQVFGAEDPELGGTDAQQAMAAALMDFGMYFQQMTEDRRAHPTDDLASTIATGTIAGAPLGDFQTIGYYSSAVNGIGRSACNVAHLVRRAQRRICYRGNNSPLSRCGRADRRSPGSTPRDGQRGPSRPRRS